MRGTTAEDRGVLARWAAGGVSLRLLVIRGTMHSVTCYREST